MAVLVSLVWNAKWPTKRGAFFVLAFKEHSLKHVLGDGLFDDVYERSQVGFQPWKVVEIFFVFTFLPNSQTWLVLTSPANLVCDTLGLHILCVFINLNM